MDQTKANMACAIIVAYNIGTRLLSCFDSIKDQAGEVVLVDNGSDQETLSVLHRLEATDLHVKVFYNETNLGIAAALNIGVKYAIDKGYPYILTLDHDSLATPTMAEKLLSGFQALVEEGIDNVRIMAPIPFDTNINSSLIEVIPGKNDYGVQEVGRVISSGSMIDSRLFKEIGFFNENLFMYYVDDEFCLRCRHNNFKIYICHPALLLHKEGAKEIRKFLWKKVIYRGYDYRATYYRSRNVIYMLMNHHSYDRCYFRTFRRTCQIVKHFCFEAIKIILFDKKRLKLLYFMIKGVSDGITGKYGKLFG